MICANKECLNEKEFTPKTHNQKYCSEECCRIATNKRIMEKYYEKKAIRNGTIIRKCKKCKSKLSIYHNENFCSSCEKSLNIETRNNLLRMIDDIS